MTFPARLTQKELQARARGVRVVSRLFEAIASGKAEGKAVSFVVRPLTLLALVRAVPLPRWGEGKIPAPLLCWRWFVTMTLLLSLRWV